MIISELTRDLAFLALFILGDASILAAGGLIALSLLDGIISAVQIIRS